MQRFIYFSKTILLYAGAFGLFMLAPVLLSSVSRASDSGSDKDLAPDFSLFEDPNEKRNSEDKSETQAQEPCISCTTQPSKNDSLKAGKKILEKVRKKKTSTKISKNEPECITCGKVKLNLKKKGSYAGAEVWKQYPQISGYSENPQVKAMISYAERHARRVSGKWCYRSVKEALCRSQRGGRCNGGTLVSKYLHGTPVFPEHRSRARNKIGSNAIKNLKSEGFINMLDHPEFSELIKNPASAPKGAILVYSGGSFGGHIEIKTGHGTSGSYVSDFKAPESVMRNELAGRASRNYKLVGVMVKPAEKL